MKIGKKPIRGRSENKIKVSDDEISSNERQKETKSVEKVRIETIEENSDEDNKSPEKTKR